MRDNSLWDVVCVPNNQTRKQYLALFGAICQIIPYTYVPSHVLTNRKMPGGIIRWILNREVYCRNPVFAMLNEFFKRSRTFTSYTRTRLDHVGSCCKGHLRMRFLGKKIHFWEKSQNMSQDIIEEILEREKKSN
jgi:hypothetical protein